MPSTALKHFNGLKGNFKMESHVLLQTLESVSLTRKSRSKTIALFFCFISNQLDGSVPDLHRGQGLCPLTVRGTWSLAALASDEVTSQAGSFSDHPNSLLHLFNTTLQASAGPAHPLVPPEVFLATWQPWVWDNAERGWRSPSPPCVP